MKRFRRPLVAVTAAALVSVGLSVFTATPASAAVLGTVTVNPLSGTDSTNFSGSVNAACPAGTTDSYFDITGSDISGGFLGQGSSTGTGPQSFSGASIANLKTTNPGSFATSGPYVITFNCFGASSVTDTYETTLNYVAGGGGAWSISVPDRATATTLSASPAGPFEVGTLTDLTADVTPTTGADNPTSGSVEFFRGATSLGIDNTVSSTGVANLNGVSLPQGSNSLTAVYTPGTGFTGSTSPAVVVEVTPVAARPTTSALTVDPTGGAAYQAVTFTCTVSAGSFNANGTARFLDNGVQFASAPVTGGAPATVTNSSRGPGAHDFVCAFEGSAPYTNSTSTAVPASYTQQGSADEQTVVVDIPAGAIVITTPYTPQSPLSLGVATLDASDSTYSASATFNDIVITDTRAGNLGWTASVVAGDFTNGTSTFGGDRAGLTGLVATQVANNALQASDVVLTNTSPAAPGLGVPRQFARYAAGKPTGTADLTGTFGIDQVPTSVAPGTYTSTVTFTAV